MANKYTRTEVDIKKLKELYHQGMTQTEVAEETGLTQKIVWSRLREANVKSRPAAPRNQKGELNNNWVGSDAGYKAFHRRMMVLKGRPKCCEVCGTTDSSKNYDWANLTSKYDDPKDYKRMCRSCHWKYDRTAKNFKGATGGRPAPKEVQNAE